MILAAPLVIPFAKAVGISVATLGMAKAADMVNDYIEANPEESMKILSTIVPGVGISQVFMNKEKISLEDLDEMTDEEAQDLSKEEKAELMKQAGKSGGSNKRQTMIDISEKLGLSGEGKEKQDIEYDIDERYDEGGVEEVSKPKFDYKKFFRNRRADGGAIGIEVLFGPKRDEFSIGGQAQKTNTTPYDARASIMDYATALDKVGAGTQTQKSQSLTDYGKNFLAGLDTSKLNPATRSFAASYGIGQPITKFDQLGQGVGQALQGAIMRTLKDPRSEGISLKNIPVSSYTSYFKDRRSANTAGLFDAGYNSLLDQAKDMTAALAGDVSAIARTTAGRFNVDIDPEARTGLIRDRYDFPKKMPGSTPYDINIALPQKFVDEILNSPEYQKITGYKPTQTRTPLSESDFYNQFYGVPYQGFENKYFQTLQKGDPYYDEVRRSSSAGSFSDLVDRGIVQAYTGPTDYKNYLSTFADGGRVGFDLGGLTGPAKSIYDSMMAAGYFTEDEIRNAIINAGYEIPNETPTQDTGVIASAPNIINQDRGGDGPSTPPGPTFNRDDNLGTSDYQGTGPGIIDGLKNAATGLFDLYQKFSPFGIVSKFLQDRAEKQQELQDNAVEKARKEREMQQAIAEAERKERERAAQYGATNYGKGVGGQSYSGDAVGAPGLGFGVGATTGGPVSNRTGRGRQDYSKGGLASMFAEKK